ncbi:MAG: NosD domain-containing protein [Candidatus Hermodarchaeota archaeon]
MAHRDRVSICFLTVTLFMFLMALAVCVTPVADLDGTAHQSTTAVSDTRKGGMLAAGIPHGPIAIDGDANFADTALLEGWPGDGSPENPYIIDGLDIDLGGGEGSCIMIYNTLAFFIISNCNLTGGGWGINGGVGIYLENVANGELVNNTCNDINGDGIFLSVSSQNNVSDNTCNNNRWGICLVESDSNTVENNTCSSNLYVGIRISDAGWNEIHDNTCSSNTECGISLEAHSDSNTVTDNTCNNNTRNGISLDESYSNTVANNTCFYNGGNGISLYQSDSNTVIYNTCNGNGIGIRLHDSDSNTVANNTCNSNNYIGISLEDSHSNTVIYNACNGNDIGISLHDSDSNTVENNICNYNRIGIYLLNSLQNTVAYNICFGNSERGILGEFEAEESEVPEFNPGVLLLIGFAGILVLWAGWRTAKLSRTGISETWIGGYPTPSEPVKALWRLKCPHCAAVYAYDEQIGIEPGFVRCQNCDREFGPTADRQASQDSPEEDVQ